MCVLVRKSIIDKYTTYASVSCRNLEPPLYKHPQWAFEVKNFLCLAVKLLK